MCVRQDSYFNTDLRGAGMKRMVKATLPRLVAAAASERARAEALSQMTALEEDFDDDF